MFPGSVVLLCVIHVYRYFKDKVFTGKAFWGEAGEKNYFSGEDKEILMKQIAAVRDAPSETLYYEREAKLLETCQELYIRPSQSTKPVGFVEYYNKNWKSCSFRWVFAYRKNLPTNGANDTQAIESTFSAIKLYTKIEFGRRTPTLSELLLVLPRVLAKRTAEREQEYIQKRLIIHHENPKFDHALQIASWKLNLGGMKTFYEALQMTDDKMGKCEDTRLPFPLKELVVTK